MRYFLAVFLQLILWGTLFAQENDSNPCGTAVRSECTNCSALDNAMNEPPDYWLDD